MLLLLSEISAADAIDLESKASLIFFVCDMLTKAQSEYDHEQLKQK